jgi:hypothetical protein
MPYTPPPIREAEFEAVDISDEDEVLVGFKSMFEISTHILISFRA